MMLVQIIMAAGPVVNDAAAGGSIDWSAFWGFVRNVLTVISLAGGLFFVLAGAVGVIRLPDFYTRLHAAGMTDTLGAELILFGLILQADGWQVIAKLLLVAFFLFVTSPTATHAVAHAAYKAGEKPLLGRWRAPSLEDEA
ncbi:MAG: monovalent cation/H(+) antiporter subunit G [Litorimonas sp.]